MYLQDPNLMNMLFTLPLVVLEILLLILISPNIFKRNKEKRRQNQFLLVLVLTAFSVTLYYLSIVATASNNSDLIIAGAIALVLLILGINYRKHSKQGNAPSFTLIELLIVFGIIAVLAAVTTLALNPTEMFKEARDGKRLAHISQLDSALSLASTASSFDKDGPNYTNSCIGEASQRIFVSVPSDNGETSPTPPSGWSYVRVPEVDLVKNNGTGWLPVDFNSLTATLGTNLLNVLPIDPDNTFASGLYYSYACGSYEISAGLESERHGIRQIDDGGDDPDAFEVGTLSKEEIALVQAAPSRGIFAWWTFDERSDSKIGDKIIKNGITYPGETGTMLALFDENNTLLTDTTNVRVPGKISNGIKLGSDPGAARGIVTPIDNQVHRGTKHLEIDGDDLTLSLWANLDAGSTASNQALINLQLPGYNMDTPYDLFCQGDKLAYAYTQNDSWSAIANETMVSDLTCEEGSWHHYALTRKSADIYTPAQIYLYKDGQVEDMGVAAYPRSTICTGFCSSRLLGESIVIGARIEDGTSEFKTDQLNGIVDDVRVYKSALSAGEINRIYNLFK